MAPPHFSRLRYSVGTDVGIGGMPGLLMAAARGLLRRVDEVLREALREAVRTYGNGPEWRETMLRGMAKDFSWKTSAAAYSALYKRLLGE